MLSRQHDHIGLLALPNFWAGANQKPKVIWSCKQHSVNADFCVLHRPQLAIVCMCKGCFGQCEGGPRKKILHIHYQKWPSDRCLFCWLKFFQTSQEKLHFIYFETNTKKWQKIHHEKALYWCCTIYSIDVTKIFLQINWFHVSWWLWWCNVSVTATLDQSVLVVV